MIWELAQDHHSGQPDPLLLAIKQALATPGATKIQLNGQNADLSFDSLPLGAYRVQWTSNLGLGLWYTLAITNVSGTGGVLHIPDSSPGQASRFYRIQTPP